MSEKYITAISNISSYLRNWFYVLLLSIQTVWLSSKMDGQWRRPACSPITYTSQLCTTVSTFSSPVSLFQHKKCLPLQKGRGHFPLLKETPDKFLPLHYNNNCIQATRNSRITSCDWDKILRSQSLTNHVSLTLVL